MTLPNMISKSNNSDLKKVERVFTPEEIIDLNMLQDAQHRTK